MSKADAIKKCENIYCPKYYIKELSLLKNVLSAFNDRGEKKILSQFKDLNEKQKKSLGNEIKKFKKSLKDNIKDKKFHNDVTEKCKEIYCNPGCKGTIFQNGEFPKEIEKKYSKSENVIKSFKDLRKSLLEGKKSMIKDDFYIKLRGAKRLKKEGALSGCTLKAI